MKELVAPLVTGVFMFLIGYLGFRTKTKENRISEQSEALKGYNDLVANYRLEIERLNKRVGELEEEFAREHKLRLEDQHRYMNDIKERLRDRFKGMDG